MKTLDYMCVASIYESRYLISVVTIEEKKNDF